MAVHYKLKAIKFLDRDVPIVIQNENGPCPLIALANILLLRNQIQLSVDCPEVSQERLMALIAGYLLDSNNPDRLGTSNAEMRANLQKNVGDVVEMLPKLTTGLDVNILYHDIQGFEFTDVVAIFDLLDIQLVHGWLVDPQDKETVACIGNKSYNALIEHLVALSGSAAPKISSTTKDNSSVAAPEIGPSQAAETTPAPDIPGALPSSHAGTSTGEEPPAPQDAVKAETPEASLLLQAPPEGADVQQQADLLGLECDADFQAALTLSLSQLTTTDIKDHPAQPDQDAKPDTEAPSETTNGAEHVAPVPMYAKAAAAADGGSATADGPDDYVVVSHPKAAVLVDGQAEPSDPAGNSLELSKQTVLAADGQAMENVQLKAALDPAKTLETPKEAPAVGDKAADDVGSTGGAVKHGVTGAEAAAAVDLDKSGAAGGNAVDAAAADASGAATESTLALGDNAAGNNSAKPDQAVPAAGVEPGQAVTGEGTEPEEASPVGGPSGPGEAYLIQAFLDNTSSQLTHHGLVSLHAGLKPNQLAVFFRNNHFNTLFKYEDALYILVTDLGYLHERDVVWEKLDAIDGDTVFVTSTLQPPKPVDTHAAAEQASADFALALQLHQEEQEAAERRRREAAGNAPPPQPAARTGQPGPPGPPGPCGPPGPQQQDVAWGHRRRHGRHHRAHAPGDSRPGRPKQNVCTIM